jgi:uncharacterized membrane protein
MNEKKKLMKEEKTVLRVYAALSASIVMTFIPSIAFAIFSLLLFCGVLIAAYILKSKSEDESLLYNHMSYVIKTIWVGSLFATVAVVVGSFYMYNSMDHSPMMPCIDSIISSGAAPMSNEYLYQLFQPCIDNFMDKNLGLIITIGILCAGPVIVYFVYRLAQGLSRAMKGRRMSNTKNWI